IGAGGHATTGGPAHRAMVGYPAGGGDRRRTITPRAPAGRGLRGVGGSRRPRRRPSDPGRPNGPGRPNDSGRPNGTGRPGRRHQCGALAAPAGGPTGRRNQGGALAAGAVHRRQAVVSRPGGRVRPARLAGAGDPVAPSPIGGCVLGLARFGPRRVRTGAAPVGALVVGRAHQPLHPSLWDSPVADPPQGMGRHPQPLPKVRSPPGRSCWNPALGDADGHSPWAGLGRPCRAGPPAGLTPARSLNGTTRGWHHAWTRRDTHMADQDLTPDSARSRRAPGPRPRRTAQRRGGDRSHDPVTDRSPREAMPCRRAVGRRLGPRHGPAVTALDEDSERRLRTAYPGASYPEASVSDSSLWKSRGKAGVAPSGGDRVAGRRSQVSAARRRCWRFAFGSPVPIT
ncbi:hypothetical protein FraQA3DRAFT_4900, partial [Frankia sp. QA3]